MKRLAASPKGLDKQTVGNVGLYYVCYRLSRLGWNVMPTARNARGIDILAYSQGGKRRLAIQVKAVSQSSPIGLGGKLGGIDHADFWVICRHVASETPECFVLTPEEVAELAHCGVNPEGKVGYWLQPRAYDSDAFRENWRRIGSGHDATDSVIPTLAELLDSVTPDNLHGEVDAGYAVGREVW